MFKFIFVSEQGDVSGSNDGAVMEQQMGDDTTCIINTEDNSSLGYNDNGDVVWKPIQEEKLYTDADLEGKEL